MVPLVVTVGVHTIAHDLPDRTRNRVMFRRSHAIVVSNHEALVHHVRELEEHLRLEVGTVAVKGMKILQDELARR